MIRDSTRSLADVCCAVSVYYVLSVYAGCANKLRVYCKRERDKHTRGHVAVCSISVLFNSLELAPGDCST